MGVNGEKPVVPAQVSAWAAWKVRDLVRRAALMGAAELQGIAKRVGRS